MECKGVSDRTTLIKTKTDQLILHGEGFDLQTKAVLS